MNLIQKIAAIFSKNTTQNSALPENKQTKEDKLLTELEKISAKKTIASKQTGYKPRVFSSDKHIKDWKNAVDSALAPPYYDKRYLVEIINQCIFDAHLQAQLQTRQNGVLAEKFVLCAANSTPDANLEKLLKNIIKAILNSILYWASAVEIDTGGAPGSVPVCYEIPAENLCPHRRELIPNATYHEGFSIDLFENLLFFPNPSNHLGLMAFAAQYAIYKRFSVSDWSRHSELFGMPFLSLKTPVTDKEEIQKRHKALAEFGTNAYIMLDVDEELTALDNKTSGTPHEIYLQMIKFCDEQIAKAIVGQTGTSDQKAFVGAAQVHERVLDWYIEADMFYVRETMNDQVIPFLAKKGLLAENTTFEWKFFLEKENSPLTPKGGIKDENEDNNKSNNKDNNKDLGFDLSYESYLLSLKKKPKRV